MKPLRSETLWSIFYFAVALALALFVAAAANAGKPEDPAELVRVTTNPEAVAGCMYVTEIEASASVHWGARDHGALRHVERRAWKQLKNRTLRAQCDVVLVTSSMAVSDSMGLTVLYRGEAYACGSGR